MKVRIVAAILCAMFLVPVESKAESIGIIYDTDMGNDIDDAMALSVIHALQSRGQCKLLAVTISKDDKLSAPFVDALNTFYDRGDIPIGVVKGGVSGKPSKYTKLVKQKVNGKYIYDHDLQNGDNAPDASSLLRRVLAGQEPQTVIIVQVGFSTNLARLLGSTADRFSDLDGIALIKEKVKFLSVMAGEFSARENNTARQFVEFNIRHDVDSARELIRHWPTLAIFSGYEIGDAMRYTSDNIFTDYAYAMNHPIAEAYHLFSPPPQNRPMWDLTSVLYAVYGNRYFDVSQRGWVRIDKMGQTTFSRDERGKHRYLLLNDEQAVRAQEALVQLVSQPPDKK